jgi:hypothetical protein
MTKENRELIYIDYKRKISLSKETYHWGKLRILRQGNSYTCIIHPAHFDAIQREENFKDEQGYIWQPKIEGELVHLKGKDNESFTLPFAQLQ